MATARYKAACDPCHASKVKCPGGGPPCKRCVKSSDQACRYSLARRMGKPPETRNRKTLERLRETMAARDRSSPTTSSGSQATMEAQDRSSPTTSSGSIVTMESARDETVARPMDVGLVSPSREPILFQPLSPLVTCPGFSDALQPMGDFEFYPDVPAASTRHRFSSADFGCSSLRTTSTPVAATHDDDSDDGEDEDRDEVDEVDDGRKVRVVRIYHSGRPHSARSLADQEL
jgi:hypothetical protein